MRRNKEGGTHTPSVTEFYGEKKNLETSEGIIHREKRVTERNKKELVQSFGLEAGGVPFFRAK
jgi:hypothetical protein